MIIKEKMIRPEPEIIIKEKIVYKEREPEVIVEEKIVFKEPIKPITRNVKIQTALSPPVEEPKPIEPVSIPQTKVYYTPGAKPVLGYWDIRGLA